jgi:hypothetical protein
VPVGDPFEAAAEESGLDPTSIGYWIVLILLLFGLLFGSLIINETKGDGGGSNPTPNGGHHHGPGGEEVPVFP